MSRVTRHAQTSSRRQTRGAQVFSRLGKVVGVGITRIADDYAIKVNLSEPLPSGVEAPVDINGVPIQVEVVGTIRR